MTREPWRRQAACLGKAPLFDATIGDETRCQREGARAREARYKAAIAVCSGCPVREPCRADTLWGRDEGVRFGVVLPPLDRTHARAAS